MLVLKSVLVTLVASWSLAAQGDEASPFGFCVLNLPEERLCSEIVEDQDMRAYCREFATEQGARRWSWWTATTRPALEEQQQEDCDRISGGSYQKYGCYLHTKCEDTSSVSPMDVSVLGADELDATAKCISRHSSRVLRFLRENSEDGCYTKIGVNEQRTR